MRRLSGRFRLFALVLLLSCAGCAEKNYDIDVGKLIPADCPSQLNHAQVSRGPLYPMTPRGTAEEYLNATELFSLDHRGVLVTDYGRGYDNAGEQYNATFIATYIFALYQDYLKGGSIRHKANLLRQADFLCSGEGAGSISRSDE